VDIFAGESARPIFTCYAGEPVLPPPHQPRLRAAAAAQQRSNSSNRAAHRGVASRAAVEQPPPGPCRKKPCRYRIGRQIITEPSASAAGLYLGQNSRACNVTLSVSRLAVLIHRPFIHPAETR
jgi:hypothetical protein